MEYITTIHYLEKYLPKIGVIADIGSGPGRYSLWLAQHGYDGVAVDPVEKSIKSLKARFAARKLKKRLKGTYLGFARVYMEVGIPNTMSISYVVQFIRRQDISGQLHLAV